MLPSLCLRLRMPDKNLSLLLLVLILFIVTEWIYQSCKQREKLFEIDASPNEIKAQLDAALRELNLARRQSADLNRILEQVSLMKKPETTEEKNEMFPFLWTIFKEAEKLMHTLSQDTKGAEDLEMNERGPSTNYEMSRRRVVDGISEMWLYFGAQLRELKKLLSANSTEISSHVDRMLEEGVEHKRSLFIAARNMTMSDGHSLWRVKESRELSDLVQQRLFHLQNPRDCSKARKLICQVFKICGYTCQINQIFYCLVEAYGSNRTMILQKEMWTRYQPYNWSEIFLPISNCTVEGNITNWPGTNDSLNILMGSDLSKLYPRPQYLPPSVPRDLASRLATLHGDPEVWWVGQFWIYLLRPQPALSKFIDNTTRKIGFQKPIVGLHIRRTDKVQFKEASYHSLDEYMQAVDEYYTQLELYQKVDQRRIFIASDDPSVFEEAKIKYPSYQVLGDVNVSKTASITARSNALFEIISDIHHLAHSDLIVCTFSSGVGRQAYEIMQTMYPDASAKYRSLDDIYYSSGQVKPRLREVIYEHRARRPGEIDLQLGDLVEVAGNHWDGYSVGINKRTGKKGLYPSHKVIEKLDVVDFPTFNEFQCDDER